MTIENVIALRKTSQLYAYTVLQTHENIARKAGFVGTDHKYLGFFLQKGKMTAGELSALTGLTTGAVTGLIDRFEKKELLKREPDASDRRKIIVVPDTQKIMALLEPFYKEFQEETDQLIATYSSQEMEIIASYLSKSIALMHKTNNKIVAP